ncbi:MAG: hypothetical protein WKI04_16250, partial [Ferruginibacter sp.]
MKKFITAFLILAFVTSAKAQDHNQANYDESKVPTYALPDELKTSAHKDVKDLTTWEKVRRPEILRLFEDNIYGQMPGTYSGIKYSVTNENDHSMNGKAKSKEVLIEVFNNNKSVKINLVLFVPKNVNKPVPAFLLINNRSRENTDPTRRNKSDFWPAEMLIDSGYAIAAIHVS